MPNNLTPAEFESLLKLNKNENVVIQKLVVSIDRIVYKKNYFKKSALIEIKNSLLFVIANKKSLSFLSLDQKLKVLVIGRFFIQTNSNRFMMRNESELWSDIRACHFISRVIIILLNLIRESNSAAVRLLVFLENYKFWKAEKRSPEAFYSVIHRQNRRFKN